MVSTSVLSKKSGIPAGDYRLVGWDLDTTGRRLVDEICQVSAYTPKDSFSQYVMPYKDLNINARRRHMIQTFTIGLYRVLKDLKTWKVIRTKSEIYALNDFIKWLEDVKKQEPACSGIILLCHETFELAPLILIEALKRYNLLERFSELVKGFANCYDFVKQRCQQSVQSFSLKVLSKVLLDKENETITSAASRARLTYQIVHHLCQGIGENSGSGDGTANSKVIVEALNDFTSSVLDEEKAIEAFKTVLLRQNSLKPVFSPLMRSTSVERRRAVTLRSLLTEAYCDYDCLKRAWDDGSKGKESLESLLNEKLIVASDKDKEQLLNIIISHFDPSKPIPARDSSQPRSRRNSGKKRATNRSSTSETTPTSTSSPSKSNGTTTPVADSPKHSNEKYKDTSKHVNGIK